MTRARVLDLALRAVLAAAAALVALPSAAQQRIAVISEAGTPVVATQVLVATGPADEPPGSAGVAYLGARAVTAPLMATLESLGARLTVEAHKDALAFTLIVAPDAWEEATRSLMVALFRDPPEPEVVLREQRAIQQELKGRESNPADAATRSMDAAHFGQDHPWSRPTVGTAESVARLTAAEVDRFLRSYFTPERTVASVVGPVEPKAARDYLLLYLMASAPIPATALPARPIGAPVRQDYNSITTWVSVSYGLPANADLEALRFLAQLATDELSFSPSRQGVFNARGEVIPRLGGGELRFQLVTRPEEAAQWAARIAGVMEQVSSPRAHEQMFQSRLRRYRGERLLTLAAPEDRARELARRLLVLGSAGPLVPSVDELTPERLGDAVRSLTAPTTVFLGPIPNDAG